MLMMATAGLQNVPIFDSSINRHGNQERTFSKTSSILQMWRELEDECLTSRKHERFGGRSQNENSDVLNFHQTQENANETVAEDLIGSQDDGNSMNSDQSQDLGEYERERVRQIFREWMNNGGNGLTSNGSSMNSSPRAHLIGRTELERIRVVREWIQTACDQRENSCIVSGSSSIREEQAENNNIRRRLRGRQALLDLLESNRRERQRELQVLQERCPVSNFASRNRIQSLLRIRLLHNRSLEFNRTDSSAESELGFLRQRNTVSGLREGFLSRLANSNVHVQVYDHTSGSSNYSISMLRGNESQPNSSVEAVDNEQEHSIPVSADTSVPSNRVEDCIAQEEDSGLTEAIPLRDVDERNGRQEEVVDEVSGSISSEGNETTIWQVISPDSFHSRDGGQIQIEETYGAYSDYGDEELQLHNSLSYPDTVENSGVNDHLDSYGEHRHVEHIQNEELHNSIYEPHGHSHSDLEEQPDGASDDQPSELVVLSTGRADVYYNSEDNNAHSSELRELLSRRAVSSLLHSGFRDSLDQLIQSYVERQSHVHDQDTVDANPNEDSGDVDEHSPLIVSHTSWEQELHDIHLSRDVHQIPGTELQMINDLRVEMARVQHRLDDMQRLLESCMDKQLELQRSVRQEVSAALNRSIDSTEAAEDAISRSGSKWDCVSKGICYACHESKIDSLLYRCGHMCTCVNCASSLVENKGKCPMCQAPVVEVIRAYIQ